MPSASAQASCQSESSGSEQLLHQQPRGQLRAEPRGHPPERLVGADRLAACRAAVLGVGRLAHRSTVSRSAARSHPGKCGSRCGFSARVYGARDARRRRRRRSGGPRGPVSPCARSRATGRPDRGITVHRPILRSPLARARVPPRARASSAAPTRRSPRSGARCARRASAEAALSRPRRSAARPASRPRRRACRRCRPRRRAWRRARSSARRRARGSRPRAAPAAR